MAIKICAAERLQAARAEEDAAKAYVTDLGSKGLTLRSDKEDLITFHYESYNPKLLEKKLGAPKATKAQGGEGESIRYNVPGAGVLAVWPDKKVVVVRNTRRK